MHRIEKRAVAATLSKGGFVYSFSRQVVFGPQLYGGIAMRTLIIEQLVQQVQAVIKHLRCEGENHDMLRITLSWAQLGTGVGFALLQSPHILVPHLECEWIQSIRTGLTSIDAHLESTITFVYEPRRVSDCHIMDAICSCGIFTTPQIRRINACRLFLKVTLLSDITSPCGKYINDAYYKGDISDRINWPSVKYPRQTRPDKTSWAFWKRGLHLTHLKDDKKQLRRPLGAWLPAERYHHHWRWTYGPDELFHQDPETNTIHCYKFQTSIRRQFRFKKEGTIVPSRSREFFPVKAEESHRHYIVPFTQIFPFPRRPIEYHPETIQHMIQQLHPSLRKLVEHVEVLASEATTTRCLDLQQQIYVASDGGAIPDVHRMDG
jgi:hypothetical protein